MNERVPSTHDVPDEPNELRRKLLQAIATGFGIVATGAGLSDATKAATHSVPPLPHQKPSRPERREALITKEEARAAYESRLERFAPAYPEAHSQQGRKVLVRELMEPPIVGSDFEPTEEEVHAMLGDTQTGLIVIPSYHRALLYNNGDLVREMPVGTGRHKDASEGKYFTPRGFFPVRDRIETHWSKQAFERAKKEQKVHPRRSWDELKREISDMWYTLRLTVDGVATHASKRFSGPGEDQTLILDRSHGCVNLQNDDAKLVYDTLQKENIVAILGDVESRALEIAAQDAEDALAAQTAAHVVRIRDTEGDFDVRMQQQPDMADLITQVRRFGDVPLFDRNAAASVIYAPLFRNPDTNDRIFVNGVKVSERSLLLVKNNHLRVFAPPKLMGNEKGATVSTITQEMLNAEESGALNGRLAFIASHEFDHGDGVIAEQETALNVLPTFLMDPKKSDNLTARVKSALRGHSNENVLQTELESGNVLVGVLRPDEFDAFLDKKGIDRGEPVFTKAGNNNSADLVGLVLEWLPLQNEKGEVLEDTDGQWGMVLISKPSKTVAVINAGE